MFSPSTKPPQTLLERRISSLSERLLQAVWEEKKDPLPGFSINKPAKQS